MECFFNETPWESRNIGIPSYALNANIFCAKPDALQLESELEALRYKHGRFFIFARIPREHLSAISVLERSGFSVVECTVVPFIRFLNHEQLVAFDQDAVEFLPSKYRNCDLKFTTVGTPDAALATTIKRVASESFVDDRFHVDHNCPAAIADRRFVYWVDDLIANSAVCFDMITIREEVAGFMARQENNLILAGFSKTYRSAGLGEFLWLSSCRAIREASFKTAETLISINNIAVLNLYARLGFRFRDTRYSLHYWE